MKTLLLLWIKGPLQTRFSAASKENVSVYLVSLRQCVPCDFARRPRGMEEVEYWKANEFRQFLLYTGCVVLKNNLPTELYQNFMLLCVAIRLLLVPNIENITWAQQLLNNFVIHFGDLYGNIH